MSKAGYLADIHISPVTCSLLREAGYSVTRVSDVLPTTVPDREIMNYAWHQKMVILTQDLDFSALLALTSAAGPSVVSLRLSNTQPNALAKVLMRVLPRVESDLENGASD